jgi:hypothetical protein
MFPYARARDVISALEALVKSEGLRLATTHRNVATASSLAPSTRRKSKGKLGPVDGKSASERYESANDDLAVELDSGGGAHSNIATHTLLSGGVYSVDSSLRKAFDDAYARDVAQSFERYFVVEDGVPQHSINEFGFAEAMPMVLDVDLVLGAAPNANDQSIIGLIVLVMHAGIRTFWPSLNNDEWKKKGSCFVTQTLARPSNLDDMKERMKTSSFNNGSGATSLQSSSYVIQLGDDERANHSFEAQNASSLQSSNSTASVSTIRGAGGLKMDLVENASFDSPENSIHPSVFFSSSLDAAISLRGSTEFQLHSSHSNNLSFIAHKIVETTSSPFKTGRTSTARPASVADAQRDADQRAQKIHRPQPMDELNRPGTTMMSSALMATPPEFRIEHKIGLHVHFPNLIVRSTDAKTIATYLAKLIVCHIVSNTLLVNLTSLSLYGKKVFGIIGSQITSHSLARYWCEEVIDPKIYTPSPHCRLAFSQKATRQCMWCRWNSGPSLKKRRTIIPTARGFDNGDNRTCPVCGESAGVASEGPSAVADLVYALDGDGECLPAYRQLQCTDGQPYGAHYADHTLKLLSQMMCANDVFGDERYAPVQIRYDSAKYGELKEILQRLPIVIQRRRNFGMANAEGGATYEINSLTLSEAPVPLRRFSRFKRFEHVVQYVASVIRNTSVRLPIKTHGMDEDSWQQYLTPGFEPLQEYQNVALPHSSAIAPQHGVNPTQKSVSLTKRTSKFTDWKNLPFLVNAQLEVELVLFLRSLRPEWRHMNFDLFRRTPTSRPLVPKTREQTLQPPTRSQVLSLEYTGSSYLAFACGDGAHFCTNANRHHNSTVVLFRITLGHVIQLCGSVSTKSGFGKTCDITYGDVFDLPERLSARLFKDPIGKVAMLRQQLAALKNAASAVGHMMHFSDDARNDSAASSSGARSTQSAAQSARTFELEQHALVEGGYFLKSAAPSVVLNNSTRPVRRGMSLTDFHPAEQVAEDVSPLADPPAQEEDLSSTQPLQSSSP